MTIRHHPQDDMLLAYAAGTLAPAQRLVIAAHIEGCAQCRRQVGRFEAIGGILLEDSESAAMSEDALARALAAISVPVALSSAGKRALTLFPEGIFIPSALHDETVGGWRRVAPGIQISRIEGLWHTHSRGFLLKAAAGVKVPRHDHEGTELTQMLAGSLIDEGERYERGDCVQAEPGIDHRPQADPETGCICLIAIEGRTVPSHWTGRLIQRFIDI